MTARLESTHYRGEHALVGNEDGNKDMVIFRPLTFNKVASESEEKWMMMVDTRFALYRNLSEVNFGTIWRDPMMTYGFLHFNSTDRDDVDRIHPVRIVLFPPLLFFSSSTSPSLSCYRPAQPDVHTLFTPILH